MSDRTEMVAPLRAQRDAIVYGVGFLVVDATGHVRHVSHEEVLGHAQGVKDALACSRLFAIDRSAYKDWKYTVPKDGHYIVSTGGLTPPVYRRVGDTLTVSSDERRAQELTIRPECPHDYRPSNAEAGKTEWCTKCGDRK